jgi:hypothetical protein
MPPAGPLHTFLLNDLLILSLTKGYMRLGSILIKISPTKLTIYYVHMLFLTQHLRFLTSRPIILILSHLYVSTKGYRHRLPLGYLSLSLLIYFLILVMFQEFALLLVGYPLLLSIELFPLLLENVTTYSLVLLYPVS